VPQNVAIHIRQCSLIKSQNRHDMVYSFCAMPPDMADVQVINRKNVKNSPVQLSCPVQLSSPTVQSNCPVKVHDTGLHVRQT
jgi:hypothetical protein